MSKHHSRVLDANAILDEVKTYYGCNQRGVLTSRKNIDGLCSMCAAEKQRQENELSGVGWHCVAGHPCKKCGNYVSGVKYHDKTVYNCENCGHREERKTGGTFHGEFNVSGPDHIISREEKLIAFIKKIVGIGVFSHWNYLLIEAQELIGDE